MENKSLFSAIVLAFALIAGYFFYSEKLDTLEQEVEGITQEYNQKISALQPIESSNDTSNNSALEALNDQLIKAQSALKISQDKLSLATSKTSVLGDEMSQMDDARNQVKSLKGSLQSVEKKTRHFCRKN